MYMSIDYGAIAESKYTIICTSWIMKRISILHSVILQLLMTYYRLFTHYKHGPFWIYDYQPYEM